MYSSFLPNSESDLSSESEEETVGGEKKGTKEERKAQRKEPTDFDGKPWPVPDPSLQPAIAAASYASCEAACRASVVEGAMRAKEERREELGRRWEAEEKEERKQ